MAAESFDFIEQSNQGSRQDPFLNNRTFIPAKGTYKSSSTDPWMETANMPNVEFAQWLFDKRYKQIPGKMISDAKAEIRNNFERASDLWQEFQTEKSTKQPDSELESSSPKGYYSNRSTDWHKATFSELLDRADEVGISIATANFSTRYDQQHTGATAGWLNWLQTNYPQIYAHLHQQVA